MFQMFQWTHPNPDPALEEWRAREQEYREINRCNKVLEWYHTVIELRKAVNQSGATQLLADMRHAIETRTTGRPLPCPYKVPDRRLGTDWLDKAV